MLSSRDIALSQVNPVSLLTDCELRTAIAREVMGWRNIRRRDDGAILATHPSVLTTMPLVVPEWVTSETKLHRLEATVRAKGWWTAYQRMLGDIAGDFNPHPTGRQRCEAALLTARLSPMDRFC